MEKLSTSKLKAGMVTEKPIVTKHGQTIAPAGTVLSPQLIARLSFYKISLVAVTDESARAFGDLPQTDTPMEEKSEAAPESPKEGQDAPKAEDKPTEKQTEVFSQKLRKTQKFQAFQRSYTQNMIELQNGFQDVIEKKNSAACTALLKEAEELFASKTSLELFDMIHTMRSVDDSTYAHCLNVSLISRAIGKWMHMSKEDLDVLTLAGLLHDIGKVQIPDEVLNKQGNLTDEEFALIKSHAKLGHKILKDTDLDLRIKLAALQHHERYDGSGYPRGLESDEIDLFASIVAIADVYDAMTAARSYRAPKCAFQVIAAFEQDGFQKYNPNIIYTFLQRVAGCYNNSRVLLSDGVTGTVVFLNKHTLSRPIVKADSGQMIDLSQPENKAVYIKTIL